MVKRMLKSKECILFCAISSSSSSSSSSITPVLVTFDAVLTILHLTKVKTSVMCKRAEFRGRLHNKDRPSALPLIWCVEHHAARWV
jgi:hypothetical protein